MALIQQLDRRSVHHIQSGQVINEGLTSAVKELVENALDANATSIEVRFKNYGLDSIEVIDNGDGVAPENYETIALKHYTSKLRDYSDLESISTFGFRGEALSSLCALSDLAITTARACDAPKGVKLVFETSGKLIAQNVVAASKGTAVCSANLFKTLPVRRKELERNIKREYTKVLGYLQAYASICVGVKFSVFHQPVKGKRTPVFATKGNPTTRENISNVFGSKSLAALIQLDLEFEMTPTLKGALAKAAGVRNESRTVKVVGHISRPVVGEGRNAPDRQMFFVNGRPCNLPQISKAINDVYKGFNVTQSPFIFADIRLDTDAYDVNVSPDKRTILLHDQADLLENLKSSLLELFEQHEQTVPVNQPKNSQRLPSFRQLSLGSFSSVKDDEMSPAEATTDDNEESPDPASISQESGTFSHFTAVNSSQRQTRNSVSNPFKPPSMAQTVSSSATEDDNEATEAHEHVRSPTEEPPRQLSPPVMEEPIPSSQIPATQYPPSTRSPRRINAPATITIGNRSPVTSGPLPPSQYSPPAKRRKVEPERSRTGKSNLKGFVSALDKFRAPGTQIDRSGHKGTSIDDEEEDDDEVEEERIEQVDEDEDDDAELEVLREREAEAKLSMRAETEDRDTSLPLPHGRKRSLNLSRETDDSPLFLPGVSLDDSDDETSTIEDDYQDDQPTDKAPRPSSPPIQSLVGNENEQEKEADRQSQQETGNVDEDSDGEYVPPSKADAEARLRAQRRLREAEEVVSASLPSSESLARAAALLRGSPETSTQNLVRLTRTSLSSIRSSASALRRTKLNPSSASPSSKQSKASLSHPDSTHADDSDLAAETRLTLTVTKSDFLRMRIKGQFNLGFILTTRNDELFIIDQHASDEKYNFETLQLTTTVSPQPLAVPKPLELMAMDEITVISNLHVFRRNGFIVEVDEDEQPGRKCRLMSVPMSKDTVFSIKDLEELIHLLHQHPGGGPEIRPAKVRAMFAMRACRKSVMVGKALHKKQMEKIVRHMGELDKPWNCPHGRPTMRHLADLGKIACWEEYGGNESDGVGGGGGGGCRWKDEQWLVNQRLTEETDEEEQGEEVETGGGQDGMQGVEIG